MIINRSAEFSKKKKIRIDSAAGVLARFRVVGSFSRCLNDILSLVHVLSFFFSKQYTFYLAIIGLAFLFFSLRLTNNSPRHGT
jgi:hypothetical protein